MEGSTTVWSLLAALLVMAAVQSVRASQRDRVLSLVDETYDVNEWPNFKERKPTVINVQMYFNSFGSLNAGNMDYTLDMFLRQRWRDPRMTYTEGLSSYTIMDAQLQKRIWKPDTYFENVKSAQVHGVTMPNLLLRVTKTGDVLYSMRVTLTLSCNLELELYPFDAQLCYVRVSSYANTDDVIQYHWGAESIVIEDGIEISEFDLLANDTYSHKNIFATGNFSGLTASFSLRRQNGYHILQTYIPTILIVSISWVSFWLDPNAVPGRVSLGVTTLLTLTTLASGIRQSLPPVSYVKAIDVWIGVCMIMVFGALLEFTLVNWMANKKMMNSTLPEKITLPRCLAGYPEIIEAPEVGAPKKEGYGLTYIFYARALDRLSRILFPGGFFVFNLIYWPYYIILQRAIA